MSLFRRISLLAVAALAVAVVLFTPTAAAYIFPIMPPAKTVMVERAVYAAPVTEDAALLIKRPNGLGSAVYIGHGRIVTAAHVVAGSKVVSLKSSDGRISSATVVAFDEQTDLAILQTNMRLLPADLLCSTVPVGASIVAIGNPLGQEFISAYGRIAGAARPIGGGRLMYVTDMTTVMGQSGSGVFADGKVIGIVSAVMLAPLQVPGRDGVYVPSLVGFGYVVPSTLVCEMLAKLDAEGEGV
ncbi:serine protease [Shinella sp.]|uniref:serine protease n=1 Tax=Shinella sp. TaxID=1870904 RepID=UPI00289A9EB6|nr:serine protease [Shinella sp.]